MANLRKCSTNCVKQSVCAILDSTSMTINLKMHPPVRTFSRTSQLAKSKNFYEDLGLTRTATQSEIKNAYYNLSMIYHPDKNEGCELAAKRFRQLSEAYEVLGNFRTRRMYDKGIGVYGRAAPSTQNPGMETEIIQEEVEDDAQTKFYKQHMVKSQPPEMSDRMTARDFDTWSSKTITQSFQHHQYMKDVIKNREEDEQHMSARETQMGFVIIIAFMIICINFYYQFEHDGTHEIEFKKHREKNT